MTDTEILDTLINGFPGLYGEDRGWITEGRRVRIHADLWQRLRHLLDQRHSRTPQRVENPEQMQKRLTVLRAFCSTPTPRGGMARG